MRIVYAVAEAHPYTKVGGLADVGGALPKALARRGHDVTLLLPAYPGVGSGPETQRLDVSLGPQQVEIKVVDLGRRHGVRVRALASEPYFDRPDVYGYVDDDVRFTVFAKAAVAYAAARPPDVLHVNDWHLGLAPQFAREGPFRTELADTACVLTIHNLAYQGRHRTLTPEQLGVTYDPPGLGAQANLLLARGVAFADGVNTVSHGYRKEIVTPEHGKGLDVLLRRRPGALRGIHNGVDHDEFDPACDRNIASRYDAASLERRAPNKAALQRDAGLAPGDERPLAGMVSRLTDQKGVDLVCAGIDRLTRLGLQVAIMGIGDRRHRLALELATARHPGQVAYVPTDSEALARRIYAGVDLFLAPSRWEPCGLGALIALRYGAIPVVRATGGLADTVVDVMRDPVRGLGYTFGAAKPENLVATIANAMAAFADRPRWRTLQRRAMAAEFTWQNAASEYEAMYEDARRECRAPCDIPASAVAAGRTA